MDLKEESALGERVEEHWYYRAKSAAVRRALAGIDFSRILDVGAGSGFFSRGLLKTSAATEAVAVDCNYPRDWSESVDGKPISFTRSVSAVAADLVLMMDVLEHVDDDLGLLKSYVDLCPTGAHFLITVPAYNFLWSGHDVFLGHKRRYTLKETEALIKKAGLELSLGCYFFGAIFPLAAAVRLAGRLTQQTGAPRSDVRMHHPVINAILYRLCTLELPVMRMNRAFGLSVFCLARKPGGSVATNRANPL